jgi:hypothetical protein
MTDALRAITFFANVAFPAGQQRDGVKSANESTWDIRCWVCKTPNSKKLVWH